MVPLIIVIVTTNSIIFPDLEAGAVENHPTQPHPLSSQAFFLPREAPVGLSPGALTFDLLSPAIQDSNIMLNLKVSVQTSDPSGDIEEQLRLYDHPGPNTAPPPKGPDLSL